MNHNVPPYVPGRYAGPILPPPGTEPAPPRRGMATWLKAVLIFVPLFVLLMIIVGLAAPDEQPPAAPQVIASVHSEPATTGATQPAPPAKPVATSARATPATISAGTWEVPGEVKPGTYKVTAPGARGEGWACYWARLNDLDASFESINDNGNLDAGERGILVVKKTDKFVELTGDCVWTAVR